jgi:predicted transcriptional regulator
VTYRSQLVEIWDLPEWMTRTDYRILEAMNDAEILSVQSPVIIAKNLGITRQYASMRLSELVERDLVEKVDDGYYRITERGRQELTTT